MEQQLVVFTLGTEHFAVDIADVESIIKMQEITKVPQTPDFVEGITNLRGVVLPVIDLRKRMDMATIDDSSETRIVVISLDEKKVGMVVDAVSEVLTISDDLIEPPPSMMTSVDTSFITGVAKLDNRLVIMLDLQRVLSAEEREALPE